MIDKNRKAFRDADFDSKTAPEEIGYEVGQKFDDAGLPNPYHEDIEPDNHADGGRDGRGLPADFAVQASVIEMPADNTEQTDATKPLQFDSDDKDIE